MENLIDYIGGNMGNGKIINLLDHQSIYIDAHGHELDPNVRKELYDDPTYDLHLHKKTKKVQIHGKKEHELDIEIPLNNPSRAVTVKTDGKKKNAEIPGYLMREIRKAFSNPEMRNAFAHGIASEMATYPSKVTEDNRERTERTLRRIAHEFGIREFSINNAWFTHIYHQQNYLSMFSMLDIDNNRYNFLATRDYIFAEKAEPTHKVIVGVWGASNRGKTETIILAYKILLKKYYKNAIILDDGSESGDVKALLFVHGAKVGIESQGDSNSRQMQSVHDFVSIGCDVILTASRSWGMTAESISSHQYQYDIYWHYKQNVIDAELQHIDNETIARQLAGLVENFASSAFSGL